MPKLDTSTWTFSEGGVHPVFGESTGPFGEIVLGEQVGLTQLGVRLERLPPGSRSSQRHWHSSEDEFVLMLSGELTLIEDTEQLLRPGDAAAWPAGSPVGHCLANRSEADATFLIIGHRNHADTVTYPDHDLVLERIGTQRQYRPLDRDLP